MADISNQSLSSSLLATIMADESFRPSEPGTLTETGLPISMIESLILKRLAAVGICSGRQLSNDLCLPFNILEELFLQLRSRQIIVHKSSAPLNDYNYALTEGGRDRAAIAAQVCSYCGPAPVPLMDYVLSAEAQTIRAECPKRPQLRRAFEDISVDEQLFESLGPAINSGAGLFLYGEPGNGKSTLAQRITQCFGHEIWVPHAIFEDGQIIKFFDAAYHQRSNDDHDTILSAASWDKRWVKVKRPTVVVGGELTMDALEIRHDPSSNISEASLQMKSNCGCLLIDDFGRQRIEPTELLNRWIVPLESRVDFLSLSSGKKIQVPFEQLIIFSTNLEPADLVDEAFLRRIPYKIEISDPSPEEFHRLFEIYCEKFRCHYDEDVVDYLLDVHFMRPARRLRRCHPRDLLSQIRNFCTYNDLPMEMRKEYFDRVVRSYFTVVLNRGEKSPTMATGGRRAAGNPAAQPVSNQGGAPRQAPPAHQQAAPAVAPQPQQASARQQTIVQEGLAPQKPPQVRRPPAAPPAQRKQPPQEQASRRVVTQPIPMPPSGGAPPTQGNPANR
ncbi:MAG: AAA family ATPase [Planctomycetota bacterium]